MDIFILAGQSNMAGRGGVFRSPDGKKIFQQDPSFSELIKDGSVRSFHRGIWQHAVEPIHAAVDTLKTCGYGPGPMFGVQLCERGLAKTVGLVPCAVGGTEIDEWKEGSHLFNRMVVSTRMALENAPVSSRLRGLLWYQGESDCDTEERAKSWGSKFAEMLMAFRTMVQAFSGGPLPVCMVAPLNNYDLLS